MITSITFSFLLLAAALPEKLPSDLPAKVANRAVEVESKLLPQECVFLVQMYHPTDTTIHQLGFCLYPVTETQGIFQITSCVGALIEPDSGTKNAFYGKKGHWGTEGSCDAAKLTKKFEDPAIEQTVNPITSFRIKKKEGIRFRLLRDDLKLWDVFSRSISKVDELKGKSKVQSAK